MTNLADFTDAEKAAGRADAAKAPPLTAQQADLLRRTLAPAIRAERAATTTPAA